MLKDPFMLLFAGVITKLMMSVSDAVRAIVYLLYDKDRLSSVTCCPTFLINSFDIRESYLMKRKSVRASWERAYGTILDTVLQAFAQ